MRLSQYHFLKVRRLAISLLVGAIILWGFAPLVESQAQTNNVTITLGVPIFLRDALEQRIVADFEAANPGIKLQVVSQDTLAAISPANGVDTHLDTVQKLASTADVVFVTGNLISPEATRANYYLNLSPLITSDSSLNPDDFYPNLWKAFQWDQGVWALPISATPYVLTYDPDAFDKAKLTYPNENWTLDDLINAVKALNVKDAAGKVTTPGIELYPGNNDIPLYMSLLGKPLTDAGAIPNPPQIDSPDTIALLEKLKELQDLLPLQTPEFGTAPIRIEQIFSLAFRLQNDTKRAGSLLPGGKAYLDVTGVAVSGATTHPEEAYKLAKFLTGRDDVSQGQSVLARKNTKPSQGGGNGPIRRIQLPADVQALQDKALAVGYVTSDRRYYDYLSAAVVKMKTQNLDAKSAAQLVQADASKAAQTATDRKTDQSKNAVVATPIPAADPNKGIVLKFGVTSFSPQLAKKNEIEALARDFVKNNAGVSRVDIQTGFQRAEQAADKYDCFYLPYSAVPSIQLDKILPLDPYLTADPNYSATGYVGGILAQVTRDNKVWALPMGIAPTVMWYDPEAFANAGLPKPAFGWTISGFKDTLDNLKPRIAEGKPPFYMEGAGGSGVSLLMLIAAYGGTPIDWSTNPPTVKLTNPKNVDAMRQVLDLAKAGLINYEALGTTFGILTRGRANDNPLYSQQLNGLNFRGLSLINPAQPSPRTNFEAVTFPKGSTTQALSYSAGSLYISAKAQNADACYKWISAFASKPELLDLMPASKAALADTGLDTKVGKPLAAVYRDVAKVLEDPNTLKIPSLFDGSANIAGFVVQYWLFEAWDGYVLKNGNLDTLLADAQTYVDAYQTCQAGVPAFDPAQQKYEDYLQSVLACATKADPRLKSLLGGR
jgi:ABC-type glycerol-3-phosphate transport system substrate-binding protein